MLQLFLACRNILLVKIPFYLLTIIILFTLGLFYWLSDKNQTIGSTSMVAATQSVSCISSMNILRLKDYDLIKPILLSDINRESNDLEETKGALIDAIHQQQQYGNVSSAAVYLRRFSDGSWITINNTEQFSPGSLMKISILIAYLKQSETEPGILDKKLAFTARQRSGFNQAFHEDPLEIGNYYSVRQLLEKMITDSDNDATGLLNGNINITVFKKLFSDLGFPQPSLTQNKYLLTAPDCAKFLRILFNASYLNHDNSEYALKLLTGSKFHNGITKGLPADLKVAHKFGESGTDQDKELHEEGIIYLDNNPYLLVVMTKGNDFGKMSTCISALSQVVYSKFGGRSAN